MHYLYKGMTPIEKNIIVVDEQGRKYEATYPKRAKGLVKNGRARFVGKNKICLACPPNIVLEDKDMETNINKQTDMLQTSTDKSLALNMEYVLSRIDQIMNDTSHIHEALNSIREMEVNEGPVGGSGDEARGNAISQTVQAREITNQQVLKLLEKMYDDLKPQKDQDYIMKRFSDLSQVLCGSNFIADEYSPQAIEILKQSAQQIFSSK